MFIQTHYNGILHFARATYVHIAICMPTINFPSYFAPQLRSYVRSQLRQLDLNNVRIASYKNNVYIAIVIISILHINYVAIAIYAYNQVEMNHVMKIFLTIL